MSVCQNFLKNNSICALRWLSHPQRNNRVEDRPVPLAPCASIGVQNSKSRWFVELRPNWYPRHRCRSPSANMKIYGFFIDFRPSTPRSRTRCTSTPNQAITTFWSSADRKFAASSRSTTRRRRTFTTWRGCFPASFLPTPAPIIKFKWCSES